jgi:hypothetical protein
MQRKLTKNKKCKSKECTKRFDQVRFGQEVCGFECSIDYSNQKRDKAINVRAKNKRKDHPGVYLKENKAQLLKLVQHIARLIDNDTRCIDCERTEAKPCWDGGHVVSKGSNLSIAYNLHNIFRQTRGCNHQGQTSKEAMLAGIEKMYGKEYKEYVDGLAMEYKYIGLKAAEYPEKITIALKIVRELKKIDGSYTEKQRIKLRAWYNTRLGIYK